MTTTLDEARDPMTDPERLRELLEDAPPTVVREAILRNPSLPFDDHHDALERGELDAWENPQAIFTLLLVGPLENGAVVAARQAGKRCRGHETPNARDLARPLVERWWATTDSGEWMADYLTDIALWGHDRPPPRLYRLALRLGLVPVREVWHEAGDVQERLEPLFEALSAVAQEPEGQAIRDLRAEARRLSDTLRDEANGSKNGRLRSAAELAVALDSAAYGDVGQALRSAWYAYPVRGPASPNSNVKPFAERMAAAFRRLVPVCPLPDGWERP